MTAPTVQFQTVTTKRYTRVLWSEDHGETWHEPETAPVAVARVWQALQTRQPPPRRRPRKSPLGQQWPQPPGLRLHAQHSRPSSPRKKTGDGPTVIWICTSKNRSAFDRICSTGTPITNE